MFRNAFRYPVGLESHWRRPLKSFRLSFPKTRLQKWITRIVVFWLIVVVCVAIAEIIRPSPTKKVRNEVASVAKWIDAFHSEKGHLPSVDDVQKYRTVTQVSSLLEYKLNDKTTYVLLHWDGERKWIFSSATKRFTPAP